MKVERFMDLSVILPVGKVNINILESYLEFVLYCGENVYIIREKWEDLNENFIELIEND